MKKWLVLLPTLLFSLISFSSLADPQADKVLQEAFQNQRGNLQIQSAGIVVKKLKDDTEGNKHQRFILRLTTGKTVLIAHNIDIASKIENLKEGDLVEFLGEYEWNPKGGVIHWTHHDPQKRHLDGWLKHAGQIYQ